MVSNDVGHLEPGQGCPAAHLTPQGKVVALMTVLAEESRLSILSERQGSATLFERLDRLLIMEDAKLEDLSAGVRAWSLVGQGAAQILERVLGLRLSAPYAHRVVGDVRVLRTPIGYDLLAPSEGAGALARSVEEAGAALGDEGLREIVWIESGVPRWGVDVDDSVSLPELGEDTIDYQKGCYIGQEVVAKIKYLGHVNRRLRGLKIEGNEVPDPGPLRCGGREAGRLTSAVLSPAIGSVIGLAYLRRGFEAPGTEVEIPSDGASRKAVVVELPFVG